MRIEFHYRVAAAAGVGSLTVRLTVRIRRISRTRISNQIVQLTQKLGSALRRYGRIVVRGGVCNDALRR